LVVIKNLKNLTMKKYKGQSLAIVLVLLIVGSIIGFALYARMIRDSERTVEEKASSEANELTETVIGLVSTSNYEKIKDEEALNFLGCLDTFEDTGCRRNNMTIGELEEYLGVIGLEDVDLSSYDFALEEGYCFSELAIRDGLEDDEVTIEQDDAYSLFLGSVDDWSNCSIDFLMTDNGTADGFVMSTFYGNHDTEGNIESYKDYEVDDIFGFTYSSGDNWIPYASGTQLLSFPGTYPGVKEGSNLHEVRFKSLGGSSNLLWRLSGSACNVEQYLIMEVGSTCGGKYVGKSFVVPGEVFAPPVFDYVLFNGQGELRPEPIPEGIVD
jgi:hypothetical protein